MRMSPQAEQFKKCLPEGLQKVADVSFSYQRSWSIISDHLKTIYGKYADPQYCLDAYFSSGEYKNSCHIARRFSDIPLVSVDDIKQMLFEEQEYNKTVDELLAILKEEESEENTNRLASLLGILPSDNPASLFRYIIANDHIPEDERESVIDKMKCNQNLLRIITNMLTKTFTPGYLLEFSATGCVMTQPRSRFYYRGENAYYRSSKASVYRSTDKTKPASIQAFIDRLRLYQCWETLDKFDAVRQWGICEINYMALAQHYGFRTQMIDITSDLKTALFFACCKYGADQKWHPLSNVDFDHRSSRKEVAAKCRGDSRYGILYRSPSEITDLCWCIEPAETAYEIIIPVGHQPFMRCSQQHGYMLLAREDYDLFLDKRFEKLKFRLTEDICNWIFEEMEQGNLVYPYDDIPDISPDFERLNAQMIIERNIFEIVANDFQLKGIDRTNALTVLKQYGFEIKEAVSVIMPERLEEINKTYSAQYAMQKMEVMPQYSPILSIYGDTPVNKGGQLCVKN